ncbi:MAG: DegV family EDD domain-containing protein [Ruminococcaceae bacterium]|nr:DegV family EDD domain-containing protein [Oscillospiraceae bacterium]
MNKIKIVVDSSSDLTELSNADFASAPLKIVTSEKEYVDDKNLNVEQMVETLYTYKGKSSTSCPNVNDWLDAFGDAEEVFCITITSSLSGGYNSACVAKKVYREKYPERRVNIIDSLSTGPEIVLMAEKIRDMILVGKDFDQISSTIKSYKTELLFALKSMKNLANNGRISKLKAAAAGILGIRAIGKASEQGTLEMLSKCRGEAKTIKALVKYMIENGYKGGKARIDHCLNSEAAAKLADRIKSRFPNAIISIAETRGLCSFYAEKGGLLLGYEV